MTSYFTIRDPYDDLEEDLDKLIEVLKAPPRLEPPTRARRLGKGCGAGKELRRVTSGAVSSRWDSENAQSAEIRLDAEITRRASESSRRESVIAQSAELVQSSRDWPLAQGR